ncbi:MAG: methylmalonyl-CoA mutase family protein, partial [Metallibacterium sp.]
MAISSYQGGHLEYFRYMIDMLRERGAGHIRVFGGGGGTITPEEIAELQAYGVERIYHPNDGMHMGLVAMIEDVVRRARKGPDSGVGFRRPKRRDSGLGTRDSASRSAGTAWFDLAGSVGLSDERLIGQVLSALEDQVFADTELTQLQQRWARAVSESRVPSPESRGHTAPVLGLTGTGGAGKSSVVDELLLRFLHAFPEMRIAVLAVDPTRRRSGGALLGDRIRMNALRSPRVFMRSMATRRQHAATSALLRECLDYLRAQDFDLIILETAGIGQSDSEVVDLVDFPAYVMTSDYGAASQLEKIDMLDFAELIVLNKFDRRGAEDALRDVRKQWKRNRVKFQLKDEEVPVYPTIASQFNDPGVTWMFVELCRLMREKIPGLGAQKSGLGTQKSGPGTRDSGLGKGNSQSLGTVRCDFDPKLDTTLKEPRATVLIPGARVRYLAEIAEQGRGVNARIEREAEAARKAQHFHEVLRELGDPRLPQALQPHDAADLAAGQRAAMPDATAASDSLAAPQNDNEALPRHEATPDRTLLPLRQRYNEALKALSSEALHLLREWPARKASVTAEFTEYQVRGKTIHVDNYRESLSHQKIPKIAPPQYRDWGDLLRFLMRENLPGGYPYTGGVYPYRRIGEDPTRMFAGEGTPERTNRRFHYLSLGQPAARLSTAFDSVTLYGEDPAPRPDIYGKIGNSGVSIATLDDMKKLYSGFDLCDPKTSVSMTINGPAPMILAMFMNTAIDQQVEKYLRSDAARWDATEARIATMYQGRARAQYVGPLPEGNDGLGLGLLGISGDEAVPPEVYARIKAETLRSVRGTVQADILKEDQAQNTCIFSTEFALRMMGDIQQYFVDHAVRNFY